MGRVLALVILLLACGGCRNRPAALDPFLGRQKVPPPATGAVGAQPPGAWNYPAAPPASTLPGLSTPGLTGAPSNNSIYAPPGGFSPNTGSPSSGSPSNPFTTTPTQPGATTPSVPARFTGTSAAAPISNSGTASGGGVSGQPIRIVEPTPGTSSTPASRAGTFTGASAGGVDIMDLPISGRGSQPQTAEGTGRGTQQSFLQPTAPGGRPLTSGIDPATARTSTIAGQEPVYGFNAAYSQLNGKLEYSQPDGRWLLRYVEPGMRPDQLGGVVVLAPTTASADLRNGAFVSAYGRVESSGGASLPSFTATNVVTQRR